MHQQQLDLVFQSLSDPIRREILKRIAQDSTHTRMTGNGLTVTQIAKPYKVSLPAISKHLKVLEKAELITRKKQGREITFSLNGKSLKTAEEHLAFYKQFWTVQFDNLEKYLSKGKFTVVKNLSETREVKKNG